MSRSDAEQSRQIANWTKRGKLAGKSGYRQLWLVAAFGPSQASTMLPTPVLSQVAGATSACDVPSGGLGEAVGADAALGPGGDVAETPATAARALYRSARTLARSRKRPRGSRRASGRLLCPRRAPGCAMGPRVRSSSRFGGRQGLKRQQGFARWVHEGKLLAGTVEGRLGRPVAKAHRKRLALDAGHEDLEPFDLRGRQSRCCHRRPRVAGRRNVPRSGIGRGSPALPIDLQIPLNP